MSDTSSSGPLHVTIDADVRVPSGSRVSGTSPDQLAELLAGLIKRHAWESGLEIADPASVRVSVTPAGGA